MFSSSGHMLAADDIFYDCSGTNPHSAGRFKEEPYEHSMLVHVKTPDVCSQPRPHTTKDRKQPLNQDTHQSVRGSEGAHRDKALACPLLSGLVLGKREQVGSLHGVGQPLPVQMVLEQRRRLSMMETPYGHPAAGYPQPTNSHRQRGAPVELEPKCGEDRKMWIGMGVGMGLPAQAPYVSLNFHQVLGKNGSLKAPPFATLSHITDSYSYHGKEMASYSCYGQSPHSSSSPEGHREAPHCIGTSVIITNER